jgi:hypothetical protein
MQHLETKTAIVKAVITAEKAPAKEGIIKLIYIIFISF